MNKPISIILTEAKQSIAESVNSTQLSPVLLEPIIKDLYIEIQQLAAQQYNTEKTEYEKSLSAAKETEQVEGTVEQ